MWKKRVIRLVQEYHLGGSSLLTAEKLNCKELGCNMVEHRHARVPLAANHIDPYMYDHRAQPEIESVRFFLDGEQPEEKSESLK